MRGAWWSGGGGGAKATGWMGLAATSRTSTQPRQRGRRAAQLARGQQGGEGLAPTISN